MVRVVDMCQDNKNIVYSRKGNAVFITQQIGNKFIGRKINLR